LLAILLAFASSSAAGEPPPLQVELAYPKTRGPATFTGRVFVIAARKNIGSGPFSQSWFSPDPFFAQEVVDWQPTRQLAFQPTVSFPESWAKLSPGVYWLHAIMDLDEPPEINPAAARFRIESSRDGAERAGWRVFGSKPGAYGAGLQAMIDERLWSERADLGRAFLDWSGYAYGAGTDGVAAREALSERLSRVEAVVQNQDNREHDLLDSDDYYQFEGGMAAAVESASGKAPAIYHNDHSRPERPVIRTLDEEIGRVVRARAVNPKWIAGVKRHGYKGAFEIAATVDYLFAFAATTGAVRNHHFDLVYGAYLEDPETRAFIAENNAPALREMAERLTEAIDRGLWRPKSNSAGLRLRTLMQ